MSTNKYQKRKKEAREKLKRQIMKIGNDREAWKEWVEFRARFHDYTYYNRMLIHTHKPTARHVMGYRDWRKNGRQVQFGETKLPIVFPFTEVADDEEEAEEHGVAVGEEYVTGYGDGSVYAWSQTIPIVDRPPEEIEGKVPFVDGKPKELLEADVKMAEEAPLETQPDYSVTAAEAGTETLPEPIPLLNGSEHEEIFRGACQYAESQGYAVEKMEEETSAKGSYSPKTSTVQYREDVPVNQAAKTTIHEIAHGLTYDRLEADEVQDLGTTGLEIIAEGTAHMTCYMMGFDTSEYSFPYLRSHILGPDAIHSDNEEEQERAEEVVTAIKEHLRHIDRFSDEIREGIMETLDEKTGCTQRSKESREMAMS